MFPLPTAPYNYTFMQRQRHTKAIESSSLVPPSLSSGEQPYASRWMEGKKGRGGGGRQVRRPRRSVPGVGVSVHLYSPRSRSQSRAGYLTEPWQFVFLLITMYRPKAQGCLPPLPLPIHRCTIASWLVEVRRLIAQRTGVCDQSRHVLGGGGGEEA